MKEKYHLFWIIFFLISFNYFQVLQNFNINKTVDEKIKKLYQNSEEDSWFRSWGSIDNEWATTLVIDSQNNIYIAGILWETESVGLVKYNSSGHFLWNRSWKVYEDHWCSAISIDSHDNVYFTGYTTMENTSNSDVFIVKYDSLGNFNWERIWGEKDFDEKGFDIAIDSLDNIYVVGTNSTWGACDIFLIKYNSTGHFQSNFYWDLAQYNSVYEISFDSSDNMYLTINSLLLKYNITGDLEWTYSLSNFGSGRALAIDNEDNILVSNKYSDLMKINNSGDLIWIFNRTGDQMWNYTYINQIPECREIVTDSLNNIYLLGEKEVDEIDLCFPKDIYPECIFFDTFLEKYNTSGYLLWDRQCTGCGRYISTDIALDSDDNIYICGYDDCPCVSDSNFTLIKNPQPFNGACIERSPEDMLDLELILLIGSLISLISPLVIYGIYIYLKKNRKVD